MFILMPSRYQHTNAEAGYLTKYSSQQIWKNIASSGSVGTVPSGFIS